MSFLRRRKRAATDVLTTDPDVPPSTEVLRDVEASKRQRAMHARNRERAERRLVYVTAQTQVIRGSER